MILLIISLICSVILTFFIVRHFRRDDDCHIDISGILLSFIVVFIPFLMFSLILSCIFCPFLATEEFIVSDESLYCIKDDISSDTNYFLGCGGSDEDLKYYYYTIDGDQIKYHSVKADDSTLKIGSDPRVVTTKVQLKNDFCRIFFLDLKPKTNTTFIIPEGSLYHDFSIDLN